MLNVDLKKKTFQIPGDSRRAAASITLSSCQFLLIWKVDVNQLWINMEPTETSSIVDHYQDTKESPSVSHTL